MTHSSHIEYLNEHLLIGNLGHLFVSFALVMSLVSVYLYVRSHTENQFKIWARGAFLAQVFAVIGVFVILFLIIQNHYFEYAYAFQHSSRDLPYHFMISCFWEGQEGSFLLWIVWNSLLGVVLMFTSGKWEKGVLPIIGLAQVMLLTMILGVKLPELSFLGSEPLSIGSSPFELLRNKMQGAPLFSQPDYLSRLMDGNGLNPLLQNYWMVIHPPTLFLGFALTLVPFAYAITGLFTKQHREWIGPALPWALIAGLILGAGIIMGGFWAYESLSFGGYWAWDPVENASLVPWLLLIAGIHLMLIKKVTNTLTTLSYVLVIASHILVLYATFLTRSGVLGDTSVHSFTDLGLAGQLMQLVLIFVWLPIVAVSRRKGTRLIIGISILTLAGLLPFYTKLTFYPILVFSLVGIVYFGLKLNRELDPKPSDDNLWSREFWMFVGSLILILSSIQVTITTSLPVFNKIFNLNAAPPANAIEHYNNWQLPFALVVLLLTGIGQFFNYRNTSDKTRFKQTVLMILVTSLLFSVGAMILFKISDWLFVIFLFAGIYAVVANAWYIIVRLGTLKSAGASIAHIGFALMMVGVLVSSSKKEVITQDFSDNLGQFDEKVRRENMLLWEGQPERLGSFMVTYLGDSLDRQSIFFKVKYRSLTNNDTFTLYPNSIVTAQEGLMSNPDTRHYLTRDVYTYVSSIPKKQDSLIWQEEQEVGIVQDLRVLTPNGEIKFLRMEEMDQDPNLKGAAISKAIFEIKRGRSTYLAEPLLVILNDGRFYAQSDIVEAAGIKVRFDLRTDGPDVHPVLIYSTTTPQPKYIVMKAIVFPYINLLWLGTIVMLIGFGLATWHRLKR